MIRPAHLFLVLMLMALPLAAADGYRFHLSMTTLAGGLRALDPDHPSLKAIAEERLAEPVMLFEKHSSSGWRVTFGNCPKIQTILGCEIRINSHSRGSAARDAELLGVGRHVYDLGFSANPDGTVRARCLQPSCWIRFLNQDGHPTESLMTFGSSTNLPLDVDLDVKFPK